MKPYLLIDFGSTYTKMTAVDLDQPAVLGTARARTSVEDGLLLGYLKALERLEQKVGHLNYERRLACSSAAGGLKMVAIGLVPELTVEAAKKAALGAGARVIGAYGFELSPAEIEELLALEPDLILLAGGTDGGNKETILHNARLLAASRLAVPVIVAGNKTVAPQVEEALKAAGKICYRVANVLPELGRLNIEPVQNEIREIFLQRIIQAKGLDQVEQVIDGITMPTPAAVLQAAERLATGAGDHLPGMGDLLVVDVGGATTDVHSIAEGFPTEPNVFLQGLPEPKVKRTVEGDLGMRSSAVALMEHFTAQTLAKLADLPEEAVLSGVKKRVLNVQYLPTSPEDLRLEETIGYLAVKAATERHAGCVEKFYTPQGISYLQVGKDLTAVKTVIGTGGVLASSPVGSKVLTGALYDPATPESLKPTAPRFYLDHDYLFSTLGLIAKEYPDLSFRLLTKALKPVN
ncbi:MAG: MutL protein [Firmicutes bacterium]|nr:MutL protein [Bacillota bacterium]